MVEIEKLQDLLRKQFPEYTFFTTRRLSGRCIVAKNSAYSGADIFVKQQRIIIEPAIPEWKTRFALGAGAAYKKITDPDYYVPAQRISEFLSNSFSVTLKA